jgi:methionyl-tRNA synthetase
MYVSLDKIQSRTQEWIKKSWKAGKWSPNSVINADGELIDSRLKGGLRPSPFTRDLTWGVKVPHYDGVEEDGVKDKVLCMSHLPYRLSPWPY